jgi:uncharacterized protein involved in response to NO
LYENNLIFGQKIPLETKKDSGLFDAGKHATMSARVGNGQDTTGVDMQHAAFHRSYIWTALAMALGIGFTIGTHLTFILGFGFPPGSGFASFIQTHGHIQLVGWSGLFVMGISLHVIPRLIGRPLAQPRYVRWALWSLATGLVLRAVGQTVLPYTLQSRWFALISWSVIISGGLEWVGVLLYLTLLLRASSNTVQHKVRAAFLAIRPFIQAMMVGWGLYTCINLALLLTMAQQRQFVVHPAWNTVAIECFLGLVLLPVAFAFSIRLLPLYLGLAVPTWPVQPFAYAYLIGWGLQVLPAMPPVLRWAPQGSMFLSHLGLLVTSGVILGFVWQLDILTRRRTPRARTRTLPQAHPSPTASPGQMAHPFGRFDILIYTAYIWLVLAACGDLIAAVTALTGKPHTVSLDAMRHMYLMGFVTLLICGIAVRMLPGFLHQRRIAIPALVIATCWLGNAAVIGRVLLLLLPAACLQRVPGCLLLARAAFAVSGLCGWATIYCLATNLWRTAQMSRGLPQIPCNL